MKNFFRETIYLWIITRILLILFILYSLFSTYASPDPLTVGMLASNIIAVVYLIPMSVLCYHELNGSSLPFLMRSLTGGLSWMQAFGLVLYILFFAHPLLLFFPLWIFLFGLYDIYNIKRE